MIILFFMLFTISIRSEIHDVKTYKDYLNYMGGFGGAGISKSGKYITVVGNQDKETSFQNVIEVIDAGKSNGKRIGDYYILWGNQLSTICKEHAPEGCCYVIDVKTTEKYSYILVEATDYYEPDKCQQQWKKNFSTVGIGIFSHNSLKDSTFYVTQIVYTCGSKSMKKHPLLITTNNGFMKSGSKYFGIVDETEDEYFILVNDCDSQKQEIFIYSLHNMTMGYPPNLVKKIDTTSKAMKYKSFTHDKRLYLTNIPTSGVPSIFEYSLDSSHLSGFSLYTTFTFPSLPGNEKYEDVSYITYWDEGRVYFTLTSSEPNDSGKYIYRIQTFQNTQLKDEKYGIQAYKIYNENNLQIIVYNDTSSSKIELIASSLSKPFESFGMTETSWELGGSFDLQWRSYDFKDGLIGIFKKGSGPCRYYEVEFCVVEVDVLYTPPPPPPPTPPKKKSKLDKNQKWVNPLIALGAIFAFILCILCVVLMIIVYVFLCCCCIAGISGGSSIFCIGQTEPVHVFSLKDCKKCQGSGHSSSVNSISEKTVDDDDDVCVHCDNKKQKIIEVKHLCLDCGGSGFIGDDNDETDQLVHQEEQEEEVVHTHNVIEEDEYTFTVSQDSMVQCDSCYGTGKTHFSPANAPRKEGKEETTTIISCLLCQSDIILYPTRILDCSGDWKQLAHNMMKCSSCNLESPEIAKQIDESVSLWDFEITFKCSRCKGNGRIEKEERPQEQNQKEDQEAFVISESIEEGEKERAVKCVSCNGSGTIIRKRTEKCEYCNIFHIMDNDDDGDDSKKKKNNNNDCKKCYGTGRKVYFRLRILKFFFRCFPIRAKIRKDDEEVFKMLLVKNMIQCFLCFCCCLLMERCDMARLSRVPQKRGEREFLIQEDESVSYT